MSSLTSQFATRFRATRVLFVVPALLLGACATQVAPHLALPDGVKAAVKSTDIVLPIKQSEIYVFVPASNIAAAGGGGLLLALVDAGVDSVRTSKAEAAVKPLRDSLVDYNYDSSLCDAVGSSLNKVTWIGAGKPQVIRDVTSKSLDSAVAQSKADAVLFITTDYHLSNDGDVLDVVANANLFGKSDALRALGPSKPASSPSAPQNALYRNIITYETTAPMGTADRDKNIVIWSANNGAVMRAVLKQSAAKVAELLANDLQNQPTASDADGVVERASDGTLRYVARVN